MSWRKGIVFAIFYLFCFFKFCSFSLIKLTQVLAQVNSSYFEIFNWKPRYTNCDIFITIADLSRMLSAIGWLRESIGLPNLVHETAKKLINMSLIFMKKYFLLVGNLLKTLLFIIKIFQQKTCSCWNMLVNDTKAFLFIINNLQCSMHYIIRKLTFTEDINLNSMLLFTLKYI